MPEPQMWEPKETEESQPQTEGPQKPEMPQETEEFQEEKKEFLGREEIKTMAKDVSRLREIEAQKEKERLIALEALKEQEKIPPPLPREETIKPEVKIEEQKPPAFIPQLPQKIVFSKKVLVRAAIVAVILLAVGGSFYWFLTTKKQPIPEEQLPITTPTTTEGIVETPAEITIPPSLIAVQSTATLEATSSENVPALLSQFLGTTSAADGFTRILIKNTAENKLLGLTDFFAAFKITTPAGLLDKLNNDFTLFIYSSKGLNRLGFITEIKDNENLYALGKSWEPTAEKDTENLFASLDEVKTKHPTYFRQAFYKKFPFRYASFSNNKFGICWSTYNYFILTTSGESMLRIIDTLTKNE